jgi:hypothetical protein
MRSYLATSISSFNRNKLNGMLAEVEFRKHINALGFADRVSLGGWLARSARPDNFGEHTIAVFPEILLPSKPAATTPPPSGLHSICFSFHQIGISAYYASPVIQNQDEPESITWSCQRLGLPSAPSPMSLSDALAGFSLRDRPYKFLRYKADISDLPDLAVPEEFSKENLRVSLQKQVIAEVSDVDGVLWGSNIAYPLEIKEKTAANDPKLGDYFGLDIGPFVKLAFYAAKQQNLHSLFVVREIDNVIDRNLVNWWFIPFERLARFASWIKQGGGVSMQGTASAVVKIPKSQFSILNAAELAKL